MFDASHQRGSAGSILFLEHSQFKLVKSYLKGRRRPFVAQVRKRCHFALLIKQLISGVFVIFCFFVFLVSSCALFFVLFHC